jgi:hypothetical protein
LPRIEEYVDGEIDGRTAERVAAHLQTCGSCAAEFAELRREEEIYAGYRRDLEVTPAHWNIVRARIERESDAAFEQARPRLRSRVGDWFGQRRFRTGWAAALLLIALGVAAGIAYLNSRPAQKNLAARPAAQNEARPVDAAKNEPPSVAGNGGDETVAQSSVAANSNPGRPPAPAPTGEATPAVKRKQNPSVARLSGPENRNAGRPSPAQRPQPIEAGITSDQAVNASRRNASGRAGSLEFDLARHAERAELLLRSFRNVRLPAAERSLDVSYEKENARKLLYQNITLRREASARMDRPTTEILNKLEPILLDIANLPNRARPRDVRHIERRMEKQEIVATLQVSTLVASN